MAGGYRYAPSRFQVTGRKINFFRAAKPDINNIHPLLPKPIDHGALQGRARQTDIMTHHYAGWLDDLGKPAADAPRDIFVQLIGHPASYVIGFEAGDGVTHSVSLP